jgi:hypothetical protein
MADMEKMYFSEELQQMSENMASMVAHEKRYFSEELQQMSANLASMVAHLDANSPEFEPQDTKETAEETRLLKRLLTAATNAEVAWQNIREMIKKFSDDEQDSASKFLRYSDDIMCHEPMIKGLPWHLHATNPTLSIRLSLISMSPMFNLVVGEMKRDKPWSYGWFDTAVYKYILAYEVYSRHIK